MFKPPFAAAATAVLVTLSGGLFGVGEAQARAIYTGTFDPRGDVYGFEGTHQFSVDEACLTSPGWKAVNGNSGYDGNENYYESCGAAVLTGGSLTLRKYASAEKDGAGNYRSNVTTAEQTFNFSTATDGLPMSRYIWGIYVGSDLQLQGLDTPQLYGTFGPFDDLYFALEWVSTYMPVGFELVGEGGEGGEFAALYAGPDPVFLYQATCGGFSSVCPLTRSAVPGATPTFIPVPEPGSLALAGLALAALAGLRRRRTA